MTVIVVTGITPKSVAECRCLAACPEWGGTMMRIPLGIPGFVSLAWLAGAGCWGWGKLWWQNTGREKDTECHFSDGLL